MATRHSLNMGETSSPVKDPLQVVVYTSSLPRKCHFVAKNAMDHAELTAEFPPTAVTGLLSHPIRRRTKHVQAAGGSKTSSSQTMFNFPRHATSQYEARQFDQQEVDHHLSSTGFQTFLSKASLKIERVLVENCLFNPFNDHVNQLKISEHLDASKTVGTQSQREPVKGEQHLERRPRRLIHHGELCEGKFVSVLQCHPTFHGIIVAGYASKIQLEQRQLFRDSSRNTNRHFAIVWKTTQLLEPLILLEAPDDVLTLRINPYLPYVITASCHTGMIVVWDISAHFGIIKGISIKRLTGVTMPVVVPVAATLENYPCTSKRLHWTPSCVEFSAKGASPVTANKSSSQIYSAYDGFMTVWDVKFPEESLALGSQTPQLPNRVRPVFKMFPIVKDKRRDVAITCFAMIDHTEKKTMTRLTDVAIYPPICVAGTEEGEIFIMDWRNYTEMERGAACTTNLCIAFHDGPVVDILAAPHISNTVLSIGGRIWALWKSVDLEGPVLELPPRPVVIQSAAWSPWQSSVIAIGLADGLVEIWDILQSTSRPQRQIRISRSTITAIGFGKDVEGTFIAIADADGTGKITLLPFKTKSLCPAVREVEAFMEAEVRHRVSMAQMGQPTQSENVVDLPENPLPNITYEVYYEEFQMLEKKILHEVAKTSTI